MGLFDKNKQAGISDEELITRYRFSHDNQYIGELYKRYTHLVFGVCMKYLKDPAKAEDATMQIFEKLIEDLKKFEVDYFKGWLHMVARNHCLMKLRKDQGNLKREESFNHHQQNIMEGGVDLHPNEEAEEKEMLLESMNMHMHQLKEEQRTCLELFFLKEKSYKEVAEMTGYSLKEVKSHIQNGKRNLRIRMSDDAGQHE